MKKNQRKKGEDTQIVSREQYNMVRNIPHIPESEDSINLKSPSVQGGESISGGTPDPESDDDTLLNVHAMGQQLEEDLEHPQPIDIARDFNRAEKELRES